MSEGNILSYFDLFWFAILPYMALFVFFLVTIQRYTQNAFTYSSLSSQFLENKTHFWALVPFHYGILMVLGGHIIAFLLPRHVLLYGSSPLRLYLIEVSVFIGAVFTLVGLLNIVLRRLTDAKSRMVTSTADWIVIAILIVQVSTGLHTAIFNSWGSTWFASSLSPYLWSLLKLNPDISYVTPLPTVVQLHIKGAFAIILLFPFTRLVHILVVPNPYLWRKPQVVRWLWDRKRRRTDKAVG